MPIRAKGWTSLTTNQTTQAIPPKMVSLETASLAPVRPHLLLSAHPGKRSADHPGCDGQTAIAGRQGVESTRPQWSNRPDSARIQLASMYHPRKPGAGRRD